MLIASHQADSLLKMENSIAVKLKNHLPSTFLHGLFMSVFNKSRTLKELFCLCS